MAEDLAAEVWMTAARTLVDLGGGRSEWRAWLFPLAYRRTIDHFRRSSYRRTDAVAGDVFAAVRAPHDPAQEMIDQLSAEAIIDALVASVGDERADLLVLRAAGLNSAQVARIMGRTPSWVRVTQHRALRCLRQSP